MKRLGKTKRGPDPHSLLSGKHQSTLDSPASGGRIASLLPYVPALISQTIMLVVLLAGQRWTFVAMAIPGFLATLVSIVALVRRWKKDHMYGASPTQHAPRQIGGGPDSCLPSFNGIPSRSLETVLGLGSDKDGLLWRSVVRRWLQPGSLNTVVGMGESGSFRLDLSRQGPHALVAGTTGSGKSVLLQSWCISLALSNAPEDLQFVF